MIRASLNKNLKADILIPLNSNGKTIIFLGGIPSYFYKNDISQTLCDHGFTIIQPFYYGTWVSGGDFTPKNCLATLEDTIKSLEQGKIYNLYSNEKVEIKFNDYYCMGTSFGSVVLQSYNWDLLLNQRILLGGIPFFNQETNAEIHFDGDHLVDFLQRGFEYVYRSGNWDEWKREFRGEGDYLNRINRDIRYLFLQGDQDIMGTEKIMNNFIKKYDLKAEIHLIKGSHSLSSINPRQVAEKVISFLM